VFLVCRFASLVAVPVPLGVVRLVLVAALCIVVPRLATTRVATTVVLARIAIAVVAVVVAAVTILAPLVALVGVGALVKLGASTLRPLGGCDAG
jgi:hypothetical protein